MSRARIGRWVIAASLVAGCAGGPASSGSGGGCPNDVPASCPAGAAGYQATIAPLLATSCVPCHQTGGISTPLLQTHAEVYAARGAVLDQVHACRMPPAGYPPLTAEQRAELFGWLVCEAPDD